MKYLGINAINHDASVCLATSTDVLFASHSERYSRRKNDSDLNADMLSDMVSYGQPDRIIWPEIPWLKALRKIYSGERPVYTDIGKYLAQYDLADVPTETVGHHASHAALGYYTSGYNNAAILVIDAIGEWDTTSIWYGQGSELYCKWNKSYPHSMGLFYSAMTQAIGLKPNEEEYITMGMAAFGEPVHKSEFLSMFFSEWDPPHCNVRYNMHRGIKRLIEHRGYRAEDVAATAQSIYEDYIAGLVKYAKKLLKTDNLIISGGCALNCVANAKVIAHQQFQRVYVPANPGDAGLSMGAVLYKTRQQQKLEHAYLGHDIKRDVHIPAVIDALEAGEVIGLANGRAEFGHRALGNRSILADPRGQRVKDRVNVIKQRQKFRPFAPVVLAEHARWHFDISDNRHDFMQYAVRCLEPDQYPAICHVDGTSRVQTVHHNNPGVIRAILEAWQARTGCAMLLNTSLNIRGEPLVNDINDAQRFSELHHIKVF
jgi:carbamoyltransferase